MAFKIDSTAAAAATSPEEAALMFKKAVTEALAKAAADAIKGALSAAPLAANPTLQGWEQFIGGAHIDLYWDKPISTKSVPLQFCHYAPYSSGPAPALAISFEAGISIKGTF